MNKIYLIGILCCLVGLSALIVSSQPTGITVTPGDGDDLLRGIETCNALKSCDLEIPKERYVVDTSLSLDEINKTYMKLREAGIDVKIKFIDPGTIGFKGERRATLRFEIEEAKQLSCTVDVAGEMTCGK